MPELSTLLTEREKQLRSRARAGIEDLRAELASFGATKDDLDTLRQAAHDLDELFMLVVVGEFNSGKSALINTLLGAFLLEEGVTPTTTAINLLKYGPEQSNRWVGEHVLELQFDHPLLHDLAVVDTPGTNAILREHQEITEQFVPRSDLVLFVTSVERPFTESERAFLEAIRGWGKKVVLVINKVDLLRTEEELRQVLEFVSRNVQSLLGFVPEVFPVSARQAVGGRDPGFDRLRSFIAATLTAENRFKLKLASPLGVAIRIAEKYQAVAASRLELLAEDARTGESIESQLAYYREDLRAQFVTRLHEVENIVYDLSQRGDRFFEETFRLGRIFDLVNSKKIRGEFERRVITNTAERIDQSVDRIANWMVDREIQIWEAVAEELARRRQAREGELVLGEIGGNFEASRRELMQNVTRAARQVVSSFDREAEARILGETMREAVAQTALVEASAVGLGTLVAVVIGTAAADITGILAGTVIAGLGLYIIPARKHHVQKQFRERTNELRSRLKNALSRQLEDELASSVERIQTAISPYLRFVRSEQEKTGGFHDRLGRLREEMGALRREIGSPSFGG